MFLNIDGNNFCELGIFPLDIDNEEGPLWVLGDIFMSKYYSIFKRGINN